MCASVLEGKLAEARSKKDTLKARAASAKTSKQIQEMMGSLNTSNAVVAFDKMEEKVCMQEQAASPCEMCLGEVLVALSQRYAPILCLAGGCLAGCCSLPWHRRGCRAANDGGHPACQHVATCNSNDVCFIPPARCQVIAMEAESEAVGMLVAGDGLETKFAQLESGTVEDELAALKKGMLGAGKSGPVAALPEGRLVKDAIDMELEELRKKARE